MRSERLSSGGGNPAFTYRADGTRLGSGPSSPGMDSLASGFSSPGRKSTYDRYGCFSHLKITAKTKLTRYLKRILHYRHMDFEFAGWQMIYLLVAPQKVYRNFMYRKKTKDQWARDDPAFLVLLSAALAGSSVLFSIVLGFSFLQFIKFFLWVVCIDCIFTGVVIASILWAITNYTLRISREQDVEWGYAWDVHLNAFFPLLIILHVLMPILYPILLNHTWFISALIGNSLWFIAISYYVYVTFLGYTALGFLRGTQIFLYPVTFLFIGCIAAATLGWNFSSVLMDFYHFRVHF